MAITYLAMLIAPFAFMVLFQARVEDWLRISLVAWMGFLAAEYTRDAYGPEWGAFLGASVVGLMSNVEALLQPPIPDSADARDLDAGSRKPGLLQRDGLYRSTRRPRFGIRVLNVSRSDGPGGRLDHSQRAVGTETFLVMGVGHGWREA
jgi:hypothetical protein